MRRASLLGQHFLDITECNCELAIDASKYQRKSTRQAGCASSPLCLRFFRTPEGPSSCFRRHNLQMSWYHLGYLLRFCQGGTVNAPTIFQSKTLIWSQPSILIDAWRHLHTSGAPRIQHLPTHHEKHTIHLHHSICACSLHCNTRRELACTMKK